MACGPEQAQPVILVHGLAGNLNHFTYAMTSLLAPQFRVIALDRPGSGYSLRHVKTQTCLEDQAAMIWDFLDGIGVTKPLLVGHSLGGAIVLEMALQRPDAPAALALLSPATQPQPEVSKILQPFVLKPPWLLCALVHIIISPAARLLQQRIMQRAFAPEPVPNKFLINGGGILTWRPKAFISASSDLTGTRSDLKHLAARYGTDLRAPGAILFGEEDPILCPAHHGVPMENYGYALSLLPKRGHMIPLTAPEACVAFIKDIAERSGLRGTVD